LGVDSASGGTTGKFCFPVNALRDEDRIDGSSANISQELYNRILQQVGDRYRTIVTAHGGLLVINPRWDESEVNAFADRDGENWNVSVFGGLARRPEITPDAFALVACHELGHHLGGFPFFGNEWGASEGQADYFAAQACAEMLWADDVAVNATYRDTASVEVKRQCNRAYQSDLAQNLCFRIAAAGQSLANLLAAMENSPPPDFATPDSGVVTQTVTSHGGPQCRLDTYFSGALCTRPFPEQEIPGLDQREGQGSIFAEAAASPSSCTDADFFLVGKRPRCWFAPKLKAELQPAQLTISEVSGDKDMTWEPGEIFAINVPVFNGLLGDVADAKLSLTGPGGTYVSNYPLLPPRTSMPAIASIPMSAEGQRCGDKLVVQAALEVGPWRDSRDLTFLIGEMSEHEFHEVQSPTPIPDNDPTGLDQAIVATSPLTVTRLRVHVKVTHPYVGDLRITIRSPGGNLYALHRNEDGDNDQIDKTWEIDVKAEVTAGPWVLNAQDSGVDDSGTLDSWSVAFLAAKCERGGQK
jgi:hypothetical protein